MSRWWKILLLSLAGILALLVVTGVLIFRSSWLEEKIRAAIVSNVELATNARVEIGSFSYDWKTMTARVSPFVLHGTEPSGKPPLFRAGSVDLRVTVLSFFSRQVRLDSLIVDKPELHLTVDSAGRTNLPSRKPGAPGANPIAEILRLAVRRLEFRRGALEFEKGTIPLDLVAQDVEGALDWDRRGPLYQGRLAARTIQINHQLEAALESVVTIESDQLRFENTRISHGTSIVAANGTIQNWKDPVLDAAYDGQIALAEFPRLHVPSGRVTLSRGRITWNQSHGFATSGGASASGLAIRSGSFRLDGIRAAAGYQATEQRVDLNGLTVDALGGNLRGKAVLERTRGFHFEGDASGFSVEQLQDLAGKPAVAWNGSVSGPISAQAQFGGAGIENAVLRAQMTVLPAPGALPVNGNVALELNQSARTVHFDSAHLETTGAQLDFDGTLGQTMNVGLLVTDFGAVQPVVALLRPGTKVNLPARLEQGSARFTGTVVGDWSAPRVQGKVVARNLFIGDVGLDRFEADAAVSSDRVSVRNAHVFRQGERGGGEVDVTLAGWTWNENLPLRARIHFEKADVARLAKMAGLANPPEGLISGEATWDGPLNQPNVAVNLAGNDVAWFGEKVSALEIKLGYTDNGQGRLQGSLHLDKASAQINGVYRHPAGRFDQGSVEVQIEGKDLTLTEVEAVQAIDPGVTGTVEWNGKAQLDMAGGHPALHAAEGAVHVLNLARVSGPVGPFDLNVWTENDILRFQTRAEPQGRPVQAVGQIKLAGDYPMQAKLIVPPMPFTLLRNLMAREKPTERPPVQGIIEGEVNIQAPFTHLDRITGRAVLNRLVVRPREASLGETALDVTELTLRNNGPLIFDIDAKGIHVKSAKFTAKETDLSLSGDFNLGDQAPWNLAAQGTFNLAVISTFRPGLQASGTSTLNATLRGRLADPQLSGRLEIRQASLFLRDVPNGVEQAYGTVLFDRNRANVEKLTGQTGGGTFDIGGFVGFGTEFTYRLQANLNKVRVRYPEGVSTTLNAAMSLTGSSARSLLAGTITVIRSGFNVQSDLASLISQTAQPNTGAAMQNEFLQGMQFDIRVRTAANAEFQTSYTKDVQTEADLRLRGSVAKPILLGRVKINQGEVDFLGTKYTISRGEIIFYNTTSLQPAVDLDLETRVRGIQVLVNFAGPINKLNISYRSDPPLMSSEILALLAVGRTPDSTQTSLSQNLQNQGNVPGNTGSALIGGALSASVNGRLERFFGASRIKIDPTITGVDNIPQAHLTIEQSVSRDITVTFVTNLNRTQQQIWRLEWDLSRQWSVVAVRDENGLFGVDFLVRTRFK